jgi:predicted PurR-regulated permease PerM
MISLGKPIEQILGIGALLLLSIGCAIVLWPFLSALLWAAVICYSTWPIYTWFERTLGGHRGLAAALMTLSVALVLVAPFAIMVATLADSISSLITQATASSIKARRRHPVGSQGSRWLARASLPIGKAWPTTHPPS